MPLDFMTQSDLFLCEICGPEDLTKEESEKLRARLIEDAEFRKEFVALVKKHRSAGDPPPRAEYEKMMSQH
jgi:hypothetical protein